VKPLLFAPDINHISVLMENVLVTLTTVEYNLPVKKVHLSDVKTELVLEMLVHAKRSLFVL